MGCKLGWCRREGTYNEGTVRNLLRVNRVSHSNINLYCSPQPTVPPEKTKLPDDIVDNLTVL